MQLPSINRNPNLRPAGVESVSAGANRGVPVAPVSPAVNTNPSAEPKPGVINMVNPEPKPKPTDLVYSSMADPSKRLPEEATSPKDWTIKRPEKEKVEDPPPKPMSQVLMEHLKMMWTAGASAVQIDQAESILKPKENVNQVPPPVDTTQLDFTYKPEKVNKFDKI